MLSVVDFQGICLSIKCSLFLALLLAGLHIGSVGKTKMLVSCILFADKLLIFNNMQTLGVFINGCIRIKQSSFSLIESLK